MPRHEQISPEEDLASYYGNAPTRPSSAGSTPSAPPSEHAIPSAPATPPPLPTEPAPSAPPPLPTEPATSAPPPARRVAPVQRPMPTFPPEPAPVAPQPVNPVLAGAISVFLPGAGQIYAGQTIKGVVLLVLAFFTCMGGGLLNVLAAVDAYLIAQRKARGEAVGDWQFF